jgi:CheY-like chemotaxis protein
MRCLLVDDEPGIREGLAALLRLRGHDVRTAGDCAAARALLDAAPFDVVLADWRLPDGTGRELYAHGTAPILAISGHPDEVEPSPRLCGVLGKPVQPARLLEWLAARERAAVAAPPQPLATLPRDVRTALERALAILGPVASEVVDDGAFVTLRAAWPGDDAGGAFAALGGDLRVLTPEGRPELELRWCRDGRPDVDVPVVGPLDADGPWPAAGEFAVDLHAVPLDDATVVRLLRRHASAAADRSVWFLNVPERWRERLAHTLAPRIGPRLPDVLGALWQ